MKYYINNLKFLLRLYKTSGSMIGVYESYKKCAKLFSYIGVGLEKCDIHVSANCLLLFCKEKRTVYRYPVNKFGYADILRNYYFLLNSKLENIPKLLGVWQFGGVIITAESFEKGERVRIQDTDDVFFLKVLSNLRNLYTQKIVSENFDFAKEVSSYDNVLEDYNSFWVRKLRVIKNIILIKNNSLKIKIGKSVRKTRIHGDLTYNNLLLSKDSILFIDFCRSGLNFPEFDTYLFTIYNITYSRKRVRYDTLFNDIIQFVNKKTNISQVDLFYQLNGEFLTNREIELSLRLVFLYRIVVLTMQNFSPKESAALKLLDFIKMELEKDVKS